VFIEKRTAESVKRESEFKVRVRLLGVMRFANLYRIGLDLLRKSYVMTFWKCNLPQRTFLVISVFHV
jgi:hypothetical protein